MSEQPPKRDSPDEPKQKTLKGQEIPLPTRGQVFDAFRKIVSKPKKG